MAKARLMNRPADYEKLGINPDRIETWEDGIRITPDRMNWEWWYFDAMLEGGTKVVIQFFSKSGASMYLKNYHPKFIFQVNRPDGKEYRVEPSFSRDEASWSRERCDVRYGEHYFSGDFRDYQIHLEPIQGLGADLTLHSLSTPYRPGSSYFAFGDDSRNYTWLCAVPRGEVTGTLTIDGKTEAVRGAGYHDHQWGNVNFLKEWNHWVWARQNFEDCSMIVFDMVSNEKTEFTRFPLAFVQDLEGRLLFENTEDVQCRVPETYTDSASGKVYPKEIRYVFENGGKHAEYTLKTGEIIECNGRKNLPAAKRLITRAAGIDPAYTRYAGTGRMFLSENNRALERSGKLIFEFMYPGKTFEGHM